jgi:hypothetical protein
MLPGLLINEHGRSGRQPAMPAWVTDAARTAYAIVPSQQYARATRASARHDPQSAIRPLAGLGALATALHLVGIVVFRRLLDSPSATTNRRATGSVELSTWHVPFLSRGSTAVAQAHVRLAMRTPRGRSSLLSPFVVFAIFAVMVVRRGEMDLGFMNLTDGLGLATFSGGVCLLAILPFAMNQFAIDRAGLTLALLSPLHTRELLAGKAVGNGLLAALPALVVYVVSFSAFPGGSLALWLSLPLAFAATYLIAAPGAAALSALFPRAVDLNSIGQGSNPHAAANLLGFAMILASGAPAVLIVVVLSGLLHRPALTPIAMAIWCGAAFAANRLLFRAVEGLVDKRRENLGLVAT